MRLRADTKLYFLITIPFLLMTFILPLSMPARASLDGNGSNVVTISCPDYVRGTQTINVFSDITPITSYAFKIDGLTISHSTNGQQSGTHPLYCTDFQVTTGRLTQGGIIALNSVDGAVLVIDAANSHYNHGHGSHNYQAILYLDYSINNLDPGVITSAFNYSIRLSTTTNANIEVSVNNGTGYIGLVNLQGNTVAKNATLGNIHASQSLNAFKFKVSVSASSDFLLSLDLFKLSYLQHITSGNMQLIDSRDLNTTLFSDGPHILEVDLSYASGHASTNKTIIIDNTEPILDNIDVTPDNPLDNAITSISGIATDTNLVGTEFVYDLSNETIALKSVSSNFCFMAILPNGSVNVALTASDKAGNIMHRIVNINVSHAVEMVQVPVYFPAISIYARINVTINEKASILVNMTRIDRMDVLANNTMNATFVNQTSASLEFVYLVKAMLNVTLRFYSNGSLYFVKSLNLEWNPILVENHTIQVFTPSISIYAQTNATISQNASLSINMTRINRLDMFVNGTLNATYINQTRVLTGFVRNEPERIVITLLFYENATLYARYRFNITFGFPARSSSRDVMLSSIPVVMINATTEIMNGTMNFLGNVTITCINDSMTWIFANVENFSIEYRAITTGVYSFNVSIKISNETVFNAMISVYSIEPSQQPQDQSLILYVVIAGLAVGLLGTGVAYWRK